MVKRALVVIPDFPCPPIAGSHLRDLQELRCLAELGIRPWVLSFLGRTDGPAYRFEMLNGHLRGLTTVRKVFARGNVTRVKVARNLRYLMPFRSERNGYEKGIYPAAIPYDAADGGGRVVELVSELKPEVVVLRSYFVHYVPMIKALGVKVIVDAHDCDSYIAREIARAQRHPVLKLGALCAYVATRRQERRYLPLADELWETSAEAVARVRASVGAALAGVNVIALPSALDISRYPLPSPHLEAPNVILSVGSLGLPPNANAAERLMRKILPRVRRIKADTTLCVVGGGAPPRLLRLADGAPGVVMVGFADELASHYARAALVVVAVEEGNGILLKTLEAMAFGKAVVSSTIGVEGIDAVDGEHVVVARTTEEYVQAICRLLEQPEERQRLGWNARRLVEKRYSWGAAKQILRERSILFAC